MTQPKSHAERQPEEQAPADVILRLVDDLSGHVLLRVDGQGRITYASPGALPVLGYAPDELVGSLGYGLVHPADRPAVEQLVRARLDDPGPMPVVELRVRRKDGGELWVESVGTAVKQGDAVELCLLLRDLTTRREAEELRRRSDVRFRLIVQRASEAISVQRDGRYLFVNPAHARLLGFARPEELLGTPVLERVHADDRAASSARWKAMLSGGAGASWELRAVRADGSLVTVECASQPIDFDGAPAVLCFVRDVTERKLMQQQLLQAERMASVGTLAAGVAHEINNPLTYVVANLSLISELFGPLTEQLRGGGDLTERVLEIEEALAQAREGAERVRTIVRDLKSYSRVDEERRGPVDVRHVLDLSINMVSNEIRHRASLVREYGEVPLVLANEARIAQVFLNLLVNAAQAMPEGDVSHNEIRVVTRCEGGSAVIEVRDTGGGLSDEVKQRMFDPFFTTKPVGVNTGLGLFVCHSIVRALGGDIVADSSGRGTVVRVTLPGIAPRASLAGDGPSAASEGASRKGRILVIDDEAPLANLLRRTLAGEHQVTVATSGRQALELLAVDGGFDLVFCDLMMPDVTGMDVYEELRRTRPGAEQQIVFMTGGAFTPRARSFLEQVKNLRIDKPFDVKHVRRLVRERLSGG